ncbi:aspartyl protease family protein [Halomicrobium mukohataei]|uniref:Glutaminyl transferase, lysine biosynthesis regulator/ribosomal protein S6 modification enzyme n=2 Tax=Halomicrobium mukohataei TaxID=57705 RepID=C7P507_HALMD|nr:aspartyl protease family protein [Halomicrobium mukohataei]ACV49402.1 glutaminyl transferase, lysine biosynthesis regulator/ribosomal protein S6 modification enzyme [Halomicrobium mukohataei DSM 12286]QCD67229.1 glutaminyl transferase [Halomicrobium mukohataei]
MADTAGDRTVIGRYERVEVTGTTGQQRVTAKIDTGSDRSTIDESVLSSIGETGTVGDVTTRSGSAAETREIVCVCVDLLDVSDEARVVEVDVSDRSAYTGEMLVGADLLSELELLVDVTDDRITD